MLASAPMRPVLWLDLVGLTPRQIGAATPHLQSLAARGSFAPMDTVLPAVTCSAQATLLTGVPPAVHGAVGNGWRLPSTGEVNLWRQANSLVEAPKVYDLARERDSSFTCAKLFWWWNLGAQVEYTITPRPHYAADGSKYLDVYSWPPGFAEAAKAKRGPFPFFDFWGPKAGLPSSRWITDVTLDTLREKRPSLTLAYLPHLDYDHQRYGPNDPRSKQALVELDGLVGELVATADEVGAAVIAVSEYGIQDCSRPVHINRALRQAGLLQVRGGPIGEVLDVYTSRAFALADHQVAHVYCKSDGDARAARTALEQLDGIADVLDRPAQAALNLDHVNSGELVAVTETDAWFTYYYWEGRDAEPDFARTVDIHRKPGYDPCELFLDPALRFPKLRIAHRLARKLTGMRYLMDVIPIAPELVRGSHGRLPTDPADGPVYLSSLPWSAHNPEPAAAAVPMTSVAGRVLAALER
jgi:predicted AlkP superfamily pyrophosphatase or phosphodiesterase